MNSHLATVSSKLSKAVDILTHDQGKVLRALQQMNKILVNMDHRSHQQEKNRASDAQKILGALQDFQHSTTSVSSKIESTISLAGATYQSLTTTLRDQERAVQDLLENHQQRSGEYVPRHVNQHRSRPAFHPISNYRKYMDHPIVISTISLTLGHFIHCQYPCFFVLTIINDYKVAHYICVLL